MIVENTPTKSPDQLNIQDDQAGHDADYGFDDGVYVADKADNQMPRVSCPEI